MVARVIRHPRPSGAPSALRAVLLACLTALLLLAPAVGVATADTFDDIYTDFRKQQRITACKYTPSELQDAKDRLGSDSEQYLPGFPDALDEAIAASGTCREASSGGSSSGGSGGSTGGGGDSSTPTPTPAAPSTTPSAPATTGAAPATPAPATPPATTPAPAPTVQPGPAAQTGVVAARAGSPTDDGPAAWTWAVLAAAIVAAAALGWAFVNATDRIEFLAPLGHSMGEAGWRISLRWAEFRDWMRFGTGR